LASTSNYNENTNAKPSIGMPNEKAQKEFQCTIELKPIGYLKPKRYLVKPFLKKKSKNQTLGNF
jgi:hypothetical protein